MHGLCPLRRKCPFRLCNSMSANINCGAGAADQVLVPASRVERIAQDLHERALRYECKRDPRCVFTYTYYLITCKLAACCSPGNFNDPMWIANLAQAFV